MKKIRVLFPYVEAGFGHIMPLRSIEETFRRKYGDRVEVVSSAFFTETGNKHLIRYERMISRQVKIYNAHHFIGHTATASSEILGTTLSTFGCMRFCSPIACVEGIRHMEELAPDVVFSTHWATNYYAEHLKNKPFTVMYCPDALHNSLFQYHSDLNMISMPYGYLKSLRKKKYNLDNLKYVPFLIRNEAFGIPRDKRELRRKLGLPEDRFTVLLVEGGYGLGRMHDITERLIKERMPLTVVSICGKNEKLCKRFKSLTPSHEITFVPLGFIDNILEYEAACDVFCGKSGNIIGELTFFGNPSIISNCSTFIERGIADHYLHTVGSAVKEFSAKKAIALIKSFASDPSLLEPYRRAARAYHSNFGSEAAADLLFKEISDRFDLSPTDEPEDSGNAKKNK